jgi:cell division protease FtsH
MLVALATLVSVLLLGAGFAVAAQTSADRRASAADRSPVADRQPAGGSASGTTLAVGPGGLTIPADLGRPREGRAEGAAGAAGSTPAPRALSLSELLERARSRQIHSATVDDEAHLVRGMLRDGAAYQAAYPPGFAPELTVRLLAGGVDVQAAGPRPGGATQTLRSLAMPAILVLLLAGLLLMGARRPRLPGGAGVADPARIVNGHTELAQVPPTRFSDVAGIEEAVGELRELVEFLRTPKRFVAAGARLPRGFLLVGPPGTGKTLLARAVAGEAGVPFFAMSGAEFVETYVGVGAARVRKLFERARASAAANTATTTAAGVKGTSRAARRAAKATTHATAAADAAQRGCAIVFIDEIDAIGKARAGASATSGHDERESTLNQLLVEMDGFRQDQVVVLAATNRPDTLDAALLRPGRFDRQVTVPAPDRRGRSRILRIHLRGRHVADDVDLEQLARRTAGFTGADLANLANQAALAAVRAGSDEITLANLEDALATVMLGPARRSVEVAERDRTITAWHEAGHALAGLLQPDAEDPVQVTIVPRGAAGGVTWFTTSDAMFLTRRQALAQLVVAMAGRAAEEAHLGDDFTQGAAHDIKNATQLARRMVSEYGMSELGAAYVAPEECTLGPLADAVHTATRRLLDEALDTARALLSQHHQALERAVELLLTEETIDTTQLRQTLTLPSQPERRDAA